MSYLIALVLFVVYVFLSEIFPLLGSLLVLALFGIIPWIIVKSMMFNMRMTSFFNVRFGFKGDFSGSYFNFFFLPALLNIGFGALLLAIVFGILFVATYGMIDFATLQYSLENPEANEEYIMPILTVMAIFYVGLILAWVATIALFFVLKREYIYDNTVLDKEISFSSSLKVFPYVWVVFQTF